MIATTGTEAVSLQFDPVGSWAVVALIAALLATVLVAVPPDRSRVSRGRLAALVALRLLAFLALVACMLRPTLVSESKARRAGRRLRKHDGGRRPERQDPLG
jgi:hypothetical protein